MWKKMFWKTSVQTSTRFFFFPFNSSEIQTFFLILLFFPAQSSKSLAKLTFTKVWSCLCSIKFSPFHSPLTHDYWYMFKILDCGFFTLPMLLFNTEVIKQKVAIVPCWQIEHTPFSCSVNTTLQATLETTLETMIFESKFYTYF